MFIREVKKKRSKSSKTFCQYNLVQAARVEGKVKQRVILYLGSDKELNDKENRKLVLEALKSKIFGQAHIFPDNIPKQLNELANSYYQKYLIKYGEDAADVEAPSLPPAPEKADFHNVDLEKLEVGDVKSFGPEHLCRQVLEKLEMEKLLRTTGMDKKQASMALIAIASRAIYSSSEHKTAQILNLSSELPACYGYNQSINHKQLYQVSDQLYHHKEKIDHYLYKRVKDMFSIEDRLVIFDISNTYFETNKAGSTIAKYGRSKEKRNDCPVVVFTGVINAQGFIRHSRIYEGNRPDTGTLKDMITDLEVYSGKRPKKTIVMDAGIATDENLGYIRDKGYDYVCVSRKRLKDYPASGKGRVIEKTDRGKKEVELSVFYPEGKPDTWMYVQSELKRKKEQSISEKLSDRLEEDMANIRASFNKKRSKKRIEKVWERIGRIKEKHNNVSGRYEITVQQENGKATKMEWHKKPDPVKEDKEKGVYFIRTSYQNPTESELWEVYNVIREVESTFRCLKSDLQIRPVYHQNNERIASHIYLTVLAYQLVNTIRHMLKEKGINYDWKNILRIMSTQTIQTLEIPTDKKNIHLRKPAKPIAEVQQIYKATGCVETQTAVKKYVVYH